MVLLNFFIFCVLFYKIVINIINNSSFITTKTDIPQMIIVSAIEEKNKYTSVIIKHHYFVI